MKQPRTTAIYTEFGHVRPEVPEKFKVKGQRSRSQRDVTGAKICQITNNSAGDCSISITFTTDYDHVVADLPQTAITPPQIARLSLTFVQSLNTAQTAHYKCSRSKVKGVKVQGHSVS